jgi:hypothetical protein
MSGSVIPDEVQRFIAANVHSVEQLEVLLLLHRDATRAWSADEVARELRIDAGSAEGRLADLCMRRLLVETSAPALAYRFEPATQALGRVVSSLATLYAERRVSVITLIFAKPTDTIRSFADAFRVRKDR